MRARPALACASLWALVALGAPGSAHAQDDGPRAILGMEGALLLPVSDVERDRFSPGGTLAVAGHLALTKWLAPVARVRFGLMGAGSMPDSRDDGLGHLGALHLGLRFRPRGLAHPEEPSLASCIWAEVDAGLALWNGTFTPTFEAAVGFGFMAPNVTFGPVVRLVHVLPASPADLSDVLLMTFGIEVLLGDER